MKTDERLSAYLDGELDAAASRELEREMAQNAALRASYERMRELSALVRDNVAYHRAPARFKVSSQKRRMWSMLVPAFAALAALAFGIGVMVGRPAPGDALAVEAVSAHVRATLAGRLIEVASSDQHTVKPWLSSRLPFSPPVADLSNEGFPLTGARLDYLGGQPVAALVYKRREHVIEAFVSPAAGESALRGAARDGFNVERFAAQGMRYFVVSDLNRNELEDFARLLAARR